MKTPITESVITINLIKQIAGALKRDINDMNLEEIQMGMIQELSNMVTYTAEALDHKKLVKAFDLAYNNILNDPVFYSNPKDDIGHPLMGTQGTQFDTTGLVEQIIKKELEAILDESKKKLDLNFFLSIKNPKEQLDWLKKNAIMTGVGSSRAVFVIDSSKVLKFAINKFGLEQNKTEERIFKKDTERLLPKIYKISDDYRWIMSELVRPLKSDEEFEDEIGIDPYYFEMLVIGSVNIEDLLHRYGKEVDEEKFWPFFKKFKKFEETTGLKIADIEKHENWGKDVDGNIVLLDYGIDEESLDESIIDEAKKHLDLKTFKELPDDVNTRLKWLRLNGNQLGQGSSRAVFSIDSSKVLKFAINNKGKAQNELEIKISSDPVAKDFVAKIFDSAPDNSWVISQIVRPLKSDEEFESIIGADLEDVMNYLNLLDDHPHLRKDPNTPKFIIGLEKLINKYKLSLADIDMYGHWGKTPDGNAVLLDYGYNEDVFRKHYALGNDRPELPSDQPTTKVAEASELVLVRKK